MSAATFIENVAFVEVGITPNVWKRKRHPVRGLGSLSSDGEQCAIMNRARRLVHM